MDYRLEIAEETVEVQVEAANGGGSAAMIVGDKASQVGYTRLSDGGLHLVVDGKIMPAYYAATEEGGWVHVGGRAYLIKDIDKAPARRKSSSNNGPGEVTPPMPAVVVRINCGVGDRVEKGQGLVVVSAMKMETTLAAPYAGTVTAVNCAVDGQVMPGEILVDIDPDEVEAADE